MLAGLAVLALVWWLAPTLFAGGADQDEQVVQATVEKSVPCTNASDRETVRVTVGGAERAAVLSACGHAEGERVDVAVPSAAEPGELDVRLADTVTGSQDASRPLGMFLVAVSCASGGVYVFLVARGRRPVLART